MTNEELIKEAESVLKPQKIGKCLVGDVGSALVSGRGNVYRGVCIDTGFGSGLCAEQSAIATMVTAGEAEVKKLVAVWKDEHGITRVLPPCGRCREFIRQIHKGNLEADIMLGNEKVLKLKELLPYHDWFNPAP